MKKKLALFLAAILVVISFAACGGKTETAPPVSLSEPAPEPTAAPTAQPTPEPTPEPTLEPTPEPFLTKEDYLARRLSDKELRELAKEDLDTLREKISTLGDAITILKIYSFNSGLCHEITDLAAEDLTTETLRGWYEVRNGGYAMPSRFAALAAHLISDDVPDLEYLIAAVDDVYDMAEVNYTAIALCLPTQKGYWVVSPVKQVYTSSLCGFTEFEVEQREEIGPRVRVRGGRTANQLFCAPAGQDDLHFAWDAQSRLNVVGGTAQLLYDTGEPSGDRKERAEEYSAVVEANWGAYSVPAGEEATLSMEKAKALLGADLETAAAQVKNLPDCIRLLAAVGMKVGGLDLQVPRDEKSLWQFNRGAATVLNCGWADCGGLAGLACALLQGDYDKTGLIGISDEGMGGHVANWIRDGDTWYAFDVMQLVGTHYNPNAFRCYSGSTLEEAVRNYAPSYPAGASMWAYEAVDCDVPVGWAGEDDMTSYLPAEYRETGTIVFESPEIGRVYVWEEMPAEKRQFIRWARSLR